MKILLTGASGFIGRWLVKRLCPEHELFCLVRNGAALPKHQQVQMLPLDLGCRLDTTALPASVDAIIHMAQSRQFRKFPEAAQDIFQVNTGATAQLLDYGRRAKARVFLYASSGGVCGYQPRPIVETDPPDLFNFYLASKYAAECLVNAYADQFTTVNLRYFFVYGEGQRDMFMPSLVGRIIDGTPVTIAGKTGVTLNPIHVSDAVEATARALGIERADTVNVAGPDVVTVLDLAEMIGQRVGRPPVYSKEPDKGPLAMVANIEKMKLKLGVVPKVSIKEGVDRVVRDVLQARTG
jgi:UDP-glucose 4-epimerase